MSSAIIKEDYSEKCFVLRGDTQPAKEDIKAMGGKFNARLTDGSTGEKFAGWVFPHSMSDTVQTWLDTGSLPAQTQKAPQIPRPQQFSNLHTPGYARLAPPNQKIEAFFNEMTNKIEHLEEMLKSLMDHYGLELPSEEPEEEYSGRLLPKRP